ncbi:hypothetical protein NKJ36_31570 [Mesorhizobium sp. M0142]|uniref:hypothetical protein n=1 Tax=unclassified Mesorhizobium TaxID=325217 RepID=UPI0033393DF7
MDSNADPQPFFAACAADCAAHLFQIEQIKVEAAIPKAPSRRQVTVRAASQ